MAFYISIYKKADLIFQVLAQVLAHHARPSKESVRTYSTCISLNNTSISFSPYNA